MSDDLRLNSLDRFTKASDRLTLEVHSHCEIPAGCGGVILRWVNPDDGIPLVFVGGFIADAQVFLDGNEVIGNRVRLQPGEHLLAIDLTNFSTASVASLFAWRTQRDVPENEFDEESMIFQPGCTTNDSSWRARVADSDPPSDLSWTLPGYDADNWSPLGPAAIDLPTDYIDQNQWKIRRAASEFAAILQLPPGKRIHIRKMFALGENDV